MKRKLFFIVVFACCIKLFAASGLLSGEKDLKVVQTKYFDIIYPSRCEKTAAMMFNNADRIYDEVTDFMCTSVEFRIPVVITPAVDQMNAFFNPFPYNHIVLYDTSANGAESLVVYSEQFLSVFKHELTHAVSFNMKNRFWSIVGNVFGDVVDIGYLGISTGMAEGATLTSESSTGEGRLNDEYAKQVVKQAKIEGKFPKVSDVLGASTKNNLNHPYFFNGPFAQFLQDTYGREAYSQYWYYIVNAQRIDAFKSAFGISKETAWKLFEESYEVPKIPSNPVASNVVKDFFEKNAKDYSDCNNTGSIYSSLVSSKVRIAWLDNNSGKIYSVENNKLNDDNIKAKKILQISGAYAINLSNDGKYLTVSNYSNNKGTTKTYLNIYNIETKKIFKIKESGLRDGCVVYNDGEYYLVATKFETPNCVIKIKKIKLDDAGNVISLENVTQVCTPINAFPVNYKELPTGEFAFILKEKMNYSICVADINGTIIRKYNLPKKMVIHSISVNSDDCVDFADGGNLSFDYALPGTMPRYGKISLNSGEISLNQEDISGGIYNPVTNGDEIIYIGNFYEHSRLLRFTSSSEEKIILTTRNNGDSPAGFADDMDNGDNLFIPNAKKFNPFKYYTKGVFIPASIYMTEYFGCNDGYKTNYNYSILGATYITSNPWSLLTDDLAMLSVGYNIFNSSFGTEFILYKGTSTSLLQTQSDIKLEFDTKGWKQSCGNFQISSSIPFGRLSSLNITNNSVVRIGRQDYRIPDKEIEKTLLKLSSDIFGISKNRTETVYFDLNETLSITYSNVHKVGAGAYDKAGFSYNIYGGYWYEKSLGNNSFVFKNDVRIGTGFSVYIPQILPIKNTFECTRNLPTGISAKIFPNKSHLGYAGNTDNEADTSLFDLDMETILFGYEIQKSLSFMKSIYINSITLSGGYAGSFPIPKQIARSGFQWNYISYYLEQIKHGNMKYNDSVYLKLSLGITPNIGTLSGIGVSTFFTQFSLPITNYDGFNSGKMMIGINLSI